MSKWIWGLAALTVIGGAGCCMVSCVDGHSQNMEEYCNESEEILQNVERQLNTLDISITSEEAKELLEALNNIDEDYDADDASSEELAERLKKVKQQKVEMDELLRNELLKRYVRLPNTGDTLLTGQAVFPVYLEPGECLYYNIQADAPLAVRVMNVSVESVEKSYARKTIVADSLPIRHPAIYLIEITPRSKEYVSIHINYKASTLERITNPTQVKEDTESCQRGDFLAKEIQGLKMQDAFEEPRKLTLRGHLKAAFSGSAVALVPIQVPKGATDILYNLRISTNESAPKNEQDFSEGINTSYKKVRFMGLPIYESSSSSGLLSTLLGLNQPVREEDAYINMYVFYDAAQARKFQNGTPASQLKYHLDYSTLGTQSCNGRIPTRGQNTVYLAFENERMRYNNYVWLSAILAIPQKEYVRKTYSLE